MGQNNQAKRKAKKRKRLARNRRSLPMAGASPSVRPCDGCTACCSVFGVKEIDKEPWTRCDHLVEQGCSIYETRPKMCREFYCLWQAGLGPDSARPDKLGVVFAQTNGILESTGEMEAQAYEIEPKAFDKPVAIMVASELTRKGTLVIGHTYGGETLRFMGPSDKVQKARTWKKK